MRIERHRVSEAALAAVREDFANKMISDVYSRSRAGLIDAYDWWDITLRFLDGLGAYSAVTPDLDTPEAKAILGDAAETAAATVSFAAYPNASFRVFLNYVDFGRDYDCGAGAAPSRSAPHAGSTRSVWRSSPTRPNCTARPSTSPVRHRSGPAGPGSRPWS